MPQSTVTPPELGARVDVVNLGQLFVVLWSRLRLILGIGAVAAGLAFAFVTLATPQFSSETQILLESRDSVYTRSLAERDLPGGVFDEQAVASQVQVVYSRDVAREVIRRLGLVGNPEFDPLVGPLDPITRVRMMLGASRGEFDGAEEDRVFDKYYESLSVFPVARSRVIAIEFRSSDPDLAARGANVVAEVYLEKLEHAKTDLARVASSWLGVNIEDLRARVADAEAAVEDYRARSGLLVGGNNATITSQQLSDINSQLAQARSAQADAEAKALLITDMIRAGRAFEIPDVANNDLIRRLIEQRISLRSQLALEQRTLLPAHPRILELRAQLGDLDAEITASAQRTVRILENDARLAGARVESLEAALASQMRVAAQANESEVQLRALEREARAEREQLEAYLARYREALARGSNNATLPDARIVSRAVVPRNPVFPRKAPTVILATLAGLFLAAGGVVVAELAFGSSAASQAAPGPLLPGGGGGGGRRRSARPMRGSTATEPGGSGFFSRFRRREVTASVENAEPAEAAVAPSVPVVLPPVFDERAVVARLRGTLGIHEADQREEASRDFGVSAPPDGSAAADGSPPAPGSGMEDMPQQTDRTAILDDLDEPAAGEFAGTSREAAIRPYEMEEEVEARGFARSGGPVGEPEPASHEPEPAADHPDEDAKAEDFDPFLVALRPGSGASQGEAAVGEPATPVAAETAEEASPASEEASATPKRGRKSPAGKSSAGKSSAGKSRAGKSRSEPAPSEDGFRFEGLIERLRETIAEDRGRRLLVTGLGEASRLAAISRELARHLASNERAILVDTQRLGEDSGEPGFTDLIADSASFFQVIQREEGSRVHRIAIGSVDEAILAQEPEALDITLSAFDQTYDWVVLALPDPLRADDLAILAGRVDSIVLASDEEPNNPDVIALYAAAQKAGAQQVIVACVGSLADVAAA